MKNKTPCISYMPCIESPFLTAALKAMKNSANKAAGTDSAPKSQTEINQEAAHITPSTYREDRAAMYKAYYKMR